MESSVFLAQKMFQRWFQHIYRTTFPWRFLMNSYTIAPRSVFRVFLGQLAAWSKPNRVGPIMGSVRISKAAMKYSDLYFLVENLPIAHDLPIAQCPHKIFQLPMISGEMCCISLVSDLPLKTAPDGDTNGRFDAGWLEIDELGIMFHLRIEFLEDPYVGSLCCCHLQRMLIP